MAVSEAALVETRDEAAIEPRPDRAGSARLPGWLRGILMKRFHPIARMRRAGLTILAVMVLQFVLASVFLTDFVVDVAGLRQTPPSYTFREVMQIVAWLGLGLGVVLNGILLSRILRRGTHLEQTLQMAQGAFFELIDTHFEDWRLTPAERDVALLIVKGYSNSEISAILGKAEGTVKAQCNAVFRKAKVSGRVQFISGLIEELLGENLIEAQLSQPR